MLVLKADESFARTMLLLLHVHQLLPTYHVWFYFKSSMEAQACAQESPIEFGDGDKDHAWEGQEFASPLRVDNEVCIASL